MSVLKMTLTPMEPYFLGGERNTFFQEDNTKQSKCKPPYFIRSETLPSQTTLFGVTRFLGIRNPKENFSLSNEDKKFIGDASYQLLMSTGKFGKIEKISPLLLEQRCDNGSLLHYISAPKNHIAQTEPLPFESYKDYQSVTTMDGERWLPTKYDPKKSEPSMFVCLEDGKMIKAPFQTQVRVGIQRPERKGEKKGDFFKKEFVVMKKNFSFVWYVYLAEDAFDAEAGFTRNGQRLVFVGQGKTGFSAKWEEKSEKDAFPDLAGKLNSFFPSPVNVAGEEKKVWYAYAASDTYYSGELAALRKTCVFALADTGNHRSFTTNENAKTASERYTKGEANIKLLKAGGVFLFETEAQRTAFQKMMEQSTNYEHGKIAGFNHIIYV